jgi:UDP-glucose 4-epimerase
MPRFAVGRLGATMRQARLSDFSPEQLGFLTYGRGVDTTRMRTVLGFEPSFTTAEAFADFCRSVTRTTQRVEEGAGRG